MSAVRLEPERLDAGEGLASAILGAGPPFASMFWAEAAGGAAAPEPEALRTGGPLTPDVFTCTPEAETRLARILSGEGFVVSTGQQPQLFGGPLYVMYKAMTAIRLAAEVEAETKKPCLALFWVASDDHDWPEVASIGFLDSDGNHRTLQVGPPAGREGRPVGPTPLPPAISELTAEFCSRLEMRHEGRTWADALVRAYVPERSFSDAFAHVLREWMGDLPLALVDSAHPAVRQASAPLIRTVFERHETVERALERGAKQVERAGYRPQLVYLEDASPVFRDDAEGRRRVYRASNGFRLARGASSRPATEVLDELSDEPQRFSPAAALRPVLESYLLPVRTVVLGPGEIAYWAQLSPLFDVLDVSMPEIRPRSSWRIVEPRIARLLEKTGTTAQQLADGGNAAAAALVEGNRPRHMEEALRGLRRAVDEGFESLESVTDAETPGLRSSVGKARSEVHSTLKAFDKVLDAHTRRLLEVRIAQIRRAARNLYPGGVPQERAVSPFCYLLRYGESFVEDVRAAHALEPR